MGGGEKCRRIGHPPLARNQNVTGDADNHKNKSGLECRTRFGGSWGTGDDVFWKCRVSAAPCLTWYDDRTGDDKDRNSTSPPGGTSSAGVSNGAVLPHSRQITGPEDEPLRTTSAPGHGTLKAVRDRTTWSGGPVRSLKATRADHPHVAGNANVKRGARDVRFAGRRMGRGQADGNARRCGRASSTALARASVA